MKRYRIVLLAMLLLIPPFMMFASANEEWLPKEFKPPEDFDVSMIIPIDVGPLVNDIPVYPGTTTMYLSWAVNEEWYTRYHIVNLVPQANGYYNITVWLSVVNPSKKWAYALHIPSVDPDPYEMVQHNTFQRYWSFPSSYLFPYATVCPWDSYSINVVGIRIIADVVASGKLKIYEFGNQLRTDINKDGVADIFDVVIVALHYGESYYPDGDPVKDWNVLLDWAITYEDMRAVTTEFGRNIPP